MADVATILKDPNFQGLPIEERRKVLTAIDPNFASLPTIEQDKVFLATASAPVQAGPKPVSIPLHNSDGLMTPKGLDNPLGATARAALAPLDFIKSSAEQAGEGYTHVLSPQGGEDFARGVARSVKGTAGMMLPMAVPTMAAHPLLTLLGLGVGGGVGAGTEALANYAGVPEGYSELLGTGAGIAAGGGAVRGANALSNTLSIPGIPIREPAMRFWNALQENQSNPATQDAIISQLPYIGAKFKAISRTFPKPPKSPETPKGKPHWPPSAELPRSQPMKPGPAPPSAELPRLQSPEAQGGRPHWPPSAELPRQITPPPEGRPNWPPSAELPRSQPVPPGAPPPSAELPRLDQPTPPAGRPNWPPKAELPRLSIDPKEAAIQEQIAKQKAGKLTLPPAMTPPPGTATAPNRPFTIKPGEGTHLDMSHVKPGELPAKADYQTGARNLWAANMARALKGKSLADVEKMSLEELTALAKNEALGPASPDKLKLLLERLRRP